MGRIITFFLNIYYIINGGYIMCERNRVLGVARKGKRYVKQHKDYILIKEIIDYLSSYYLMYDFEHKSNMHKVFNYLYNSDIYYTNQNIIEKTYISKSTLTRYIAKFNCFANYLYENPEERKKYFNYSVA